MVRPHLGTAIGTQRDERGSEATHGVDRAARQRDGHQMSHGDRIADSQGHQSLWSASADQRYNAHVLDIANRRATTTKHTLFFLAESLAAITTNSRKNVHMNSTPNPCHAFTFGPSSLEAMQPCSQQGPCTHFREIVHVSAMQSTTLLTN